MMIYRVSKIQSIKQREIKLDIFDIEKQENIENYIKKLNPPWENNDINQIEYDEEDSGPETKKSNELNLMHFMDIFVKEEKKLGDKNQNPCKQM